MQRKPGWQAESHTDKKGDTEHAEEAWLAGRSCTGEGCWIDAPHASATAPSPTAACHVGGDGDRPLAPTLGNDLTLTLHIFRLRIQHLLDSRNTVAAAR